MCVICDEEPGSHSFEFRGKTDNSINLYYTCPAKATKYWDTKGILAHYEEVLEQNNHEPWIWMFDGQNFGFKHSLEIATAIGLISILKKHNDSLQNIHIIHPTIYIKAMYTVIKPFLSSELIQKISWFT